jgi:hypothetical protein
LKVIHIRTVIGIVLNHASLNHASMISIGEA